MTSPPDQIPPPLEPYAEEVRAQPVKVRWSFFAWVLIIVSVLLIVVVAPMFVREEVMEAVDDADGLALLEIQAKFLIGAEQVQPGMVANEVSQLDEFATSPQTAVATAGLYFYLDPKGDGKEDALRLLDEAREYETANGEWIDSFEAIVSGERAMDELPEVESEPWYFDLYRFARAGGSDPGKQAFEASAMAMVTTFLAVGAGVVGFILLGFVLLIAALIRQRNRDVTAFVPGKDGDGLLLTGFALYLFIMAGGQLLATLVGELTYTDVFPQEMAALLINLLMFITMTGSVIVGFLWPKLRGLPWPEYRQRMGWHRGKGLFKEAFSGVVGYIAMLPIFCIGVMGTLVLGLVVSSFSADDAPVEPISHPIVTQLAEGGIEVKIMMFLLAAVMAPLLEETMFRGAFYRALRGKWNFVLSGLVSGFIFAAIHPQGVIAIPALTAMGFGFAMIREWRDSLIAPMVAHAVHNGLLVVAMLYAFS